MSFNIPARANEVASAMKGGEGVTLPYTVPYLWWRNGSKRDKQLKDARYFGGWACAVDSMNDTLQVTQRELPLGFELVEMVNAEGTTYENYITRSIPVATFGKRKRWYENRSHIQILAYYADYIKEEGVYRPWGPVVLSAKGLAAKYVEDAISQWERETAKARIEHANGLPPYWFFIPLGTFGDEPDVVMVGKEQKSPITPCHTYTLPETTKEHLQKWFVGEELAAGIVELLDESQDWLHAWDEDEDDSERTSPPPDDTDRTTAFLDSDIPF